MRKEKFFPKPLFYKFLLTTVLTIRIFFIFNYNPIFIKMRNMQKIIVALGTSLLFQGAYVFAAGQYFVEEDFKNQTIEGTNPIANYVSSKSLGTPDEIYITGKEASGNTINANQIVSGGLIDSGSSKLVVSNSKFLNNVATVSSGSIYSGILTGSKVEISDSEFSGNTASVNATSGNYWLYGCILRSAKDSVVSLDNVKLDSNSAKSTHRVQGGLIQVHGGGVLNVKNSSITNNTAEAKSVARGGAIENYNSTVNISDTVFENNSVSGISELESSTETFGGAIYMSKTSSVTNLTDVSFIGNSAKKGYGGALFLESGSTLNLKAQKNAVFSGNYATNSNGEKVDENGGFLYIKSDSKVNFDVDGGVVLTIGDGTAGYDSIAATNSSNALITKVGAGEMVVNSSMVNYESNLNVNEGSMTVNGGLGANTLSIASGASFNSTGVFDIGTLAVSSNGKISLAEGSTYDVLQINYEGELFNGYIFSISDICDGEFTESVVCSVIENGGAQYTIFDKYGVEWECYYQDKTIIVGSIPEPSTYAAIFGALALAFVAYRRRK